MDIEPDSRNSGLKSAVAELHDPNAPVPGADNSEQLGFLPVLPLDQPAAADAGQRGRGRPPGAKNKSTEAWRDFILARHRSPLEALAQTFNLTPLDLARRLGFEGTKLTLEQALEIFKVQIAAAKELAPYVHQKMPLAIEGDGGGGLIQLVINSGAAASQGVQDASMQAFRVLNTPDEQNQLVTDADFTDSNKPESNENG